MLGRTEFFNDKFLNFIRILQIFIFFYFSNQKKTGIKKIYNYSDTKYSEEF